MSDSTSPLSKQEEKSFLEKAKEKGVIAKDFAEKEVEKIKKTKQNVEKEVNEIESTLENLKGDFNKSTKNIDVGSGYFGPSIKNIQKRLEDFIPELGLDLDSLTESITKEAELLRDGFLKEKEEYDLKVKQALDIGLKPDDKNWDSIVGKEPVKIVGSKIESQEDLNIAFEKRKQEYDKRVEEADNLYKTKGFYPPDSPERIRFVGVEPKRDETKALVAMETPPERWTYNAFKNEYSNSKGEIVNPEQYRLMFPRGPFEGRVSREDVTLVRNSPLKTEIYLSESDINEIVKGLIEPIETKSLEQSLRDENLENGFTIQFTRSIIYSIENIVFNSDSIKILFNKLFNELKKYKINVIEDSKPDLDTYEGKLYFRLGRQDTKYKKLTFNMFLKKRISENRERFFRGGYIKRLEDPFKKTITEEKINTINNLGSEPLNEDEAKRKVADEIKTNPKILDKSGEVEKIIKNVENQVKRQQNFVDNENKKTIKDLAESEVDETKNQTTQIMNAVNKKISAFGDNVKQMLGEVKDLLAQIFNQIIIWVKNFIATAKGMFESKAVAWIPGPMFIKDLLEAARKLYADISGIKIVVETIVSRTKEYSLFTSNIGENIQTRINNSITTIKEKITSVPGIAERKIKLFGEETINTLKNSKGVEASLTEYKQKLIGFESETSQKLKEIPSKLMKEIIK